MVQSKQHVGQPETDATIVQTQAPSSLQPDTVMMLKALALLEESKGFHLMSASQIGHALEDEGIQLSYAQYEWLLNEAAQSNLLT